MNESYLYRFGGIARLYGAKALDVFCHSHVVIVGLGGVGTWAAESLARSGIGEITLIDLDDICMSNVNRQIHALTQTIGQSKVSAMAARLKQINPDIIIHEVEDFVLKDNLTEILPQKVDYIVDCIDSVSNKAALIAYCRRNKIKIITTGGAGGQIDPTRIEIADLTKTIQDPLASKVRQVLRRDYNFPKDPKRRFQVKCVFSSEQLVYPTSDGDVCHTKQSASNVAGMDCSSGFGSSTVVTGTFGFVAASHVLTYLAAQADEKKRV